MIPESKEEAVKQAYEKAGKYTPQYRS